jgi:hypothetical protein
MATLYYYWVMTEREKAIERFKRVYGATGHSEQGNGDVILSVYRGKKTLRYKVTADKLSQVVERVRTHVEPYHYELQAIQLDVKPKAKKPGKSDRGKR